MDELTLLRRLVVDEPMDDETARDEVWRRLCDGKASPGHAATTTDEHEEAIHREAAPGWSQGLRRRRWGLVAAAAVLLLGGLLITPAFGVGSRLLNVIQGSPPPRQAREPVWSPDGRKIRYVSRGERNTWDMYVINVDGSGQRMLASVSSASAAWSPDGRRIAFSGPRTLNRFDPNPLSGIWVINADGSGTRRLAPRGYDPAWSPDGRKIAFAASSNLYVVNADGTGQRRLASNRVAGSKAGAKSSPAWSPDGGKVLFLSRAGLCDLCFNVYVVNADGSGLRPLTHTVATAPGGGDWNPVWSPDGRRIAFVRAFASRRDVGEGLGQVWVMNADGRAERKLTRGTWRFRHVPLAWSPDGRKLAFTSDRAGNAEVNAINADGRGLRRLTNTPEFDGDADWSPDGRKLAFVSNRDGKSEVYVMNADGSGQRRLTTH